MLYIPRSRHQYVCEGYENQAITWAATQAALRQRRSVRPFSSGQLVRGVQARVALGEMLSAIADCYASQQAVAGLAWLIAPNSTIEEGF